MKRIEKCVARFIFSLVFGIILVACQKDNPVPISKNIDELREVTFKIGNFKSKILPLKSQLDNKPNSSKWIFESKGNIVPSDNIQYLYYWSFNNENTVPDLAIDINNASVVFTTFSITEKFSYTTGFSHLLYPAGKAFNVTGMESITFNIPLHEVDQLEHLAFDVSSSNTGPKDFLISYSIDQGQSFNLISETNQFEDTKANAKNTFQYDLTSFDFSGKLSDLIIKIESKEGIRGEGGTYNNKSGTFKIDNFCLTGIYPHQIEDEVSLGSGILYYHIFSSLDSMLVLSGQMNINPLVENPSLKLKLSDGEYFASFVTNFSSDSIVFTDTFVLARDFYWEFPFQEINSFGCILSNFIINGNLDMDLVFERSFSKIRFEFIDDVRMDQIDHIIIKPLYNLKFFPFSLDKIIESESDDLIFIPEKEGQNYSIQFNQFMGLLENTYSMGYKILVIGSQNELLKEVDVEASIMNNVQLVFSGSLFENSNNPESGFGFKWNEKWSEPIIRDF